MKNGKISSLFDHLYLTIVTALTVLLYIQGMSRHFRAYEEKTFFMKVCLKQDYVNNFATWRIVFQMFSFMILIAACIWIMYGASWFYIWSQSKNRKVPQKFGRYQRNICTFSDTVFITSFEILYNIFFLLVMHYFEVYNKNNLQTVGLFLHLSFDFIVSFLFPLLLILKLSRNIPYLFQTKISIAPLEIEFYVKPPELSPREDIVRIPSTKFKCNVVIIVEECE